MYIYTYKHLYSYVCIYKHICPLRLDTCTSVLIYSYTYQYFYLYSAEGIFLTNSFDMTHNPQGLSCGMYCALARYERECTFICFDLNVCIYIYVQDIHVS